MEKLIEAIEKRKRKMWSGAGMGMANYEARIWNNALNAAIEEVRRAWESV